MKKNTKSFIPFAAIATILLISYILQKVPKTYGSDDSINVYQKFQSGQPIQYLVIGDSIGRGSGAENPSLTWFKQLEHKMNENDGSRMHGDYVVQSGSTAFEGLFKLSQRRVKEHKDLIFIVFGENDRKYMSIDDFAMTYEALIRKAKHLHPHAELFTITESSLKQDEFAVTIRRLSIHYGATNVDMRPVFKDSGYTEKQLTKDLVHPNGLGYKFYAETIYDRFQDNAKREKAVASLPSKLHDNAELHLTEIEHYETLKGFRPRGGYYTSSKKGSVIDFHFNGSILGVKLLRSPDGGEVNVWIDGNEVTTLNTWWPFARERYIYITNGLPPGTHTVRFEVAGKIKALDHGTLPSVRIASIITD
ncbi:SGNH/GDSL hydrolase family protein [Peribacillus sp. SI8-4]|uniref:SGNH/GDSL hydrolase family protein n=1 Tax=Peribacillus sp. SI8-4 TaxID=3048009 RepID=UPI0025532C2D|nr:SGNH/GDSL hydrolase family protein [Peribacillus sp. SI8-4]